MSNFLTPEERLRSYVDGRSKGVIIDGDSCTPAERRQARAATAAFRNDQADWRFGDAAPNVHQDWQGQLCCAWHAYMKMDTQKAFKGAQLQGDCTSWGCRTAIDQSRCNEIAAGEAEEYVMRQATIMLYAARGHRGEGANPTTIHRAAVRDGICLEKQYNDFDFREYKTYWKLASKYYNSNFPDWLYQETRKHGIKKIAEVNTDEELLASLWNGYGVSGGSQMGASKTGGKNNLDWLQYVSGSWNHEMAIIGFDARRKYCKDIVVFFDQSWGIWSRVTASMFPQEYHPIPEGMFALTLDETMRSAVRPGDFHSFSNTVGFEPQRLKDFGTPGNWG